MDVLSSRLNRILTGSAAVLAVGLLSYLFFQTPRHSFPYGSAVDRADQVVLKIGVSQVRLQRDGTSWKVDTGPGSAGVRVQDSRVKSLLETLRTARLEDEISDQASRAADFELNPESGTQITLLNRAGSSLADGLFGKQASDFTHIYFKFPNRPSIYLMQGVIRGDLGGTDMKAWQNKDLLTFPGSDIDAVLIETPKSRVYLVHKASDTWLCNDRPTLTALAETVTSALGDLSADDFVDTAQDPGLAVDKLTYAKITIQTHTAQSYELHFGAKDSETNRYPVALGVGPQVYWLNERKAEPLFLPLSYFHPKLK